MSIHREHVWLAAFSLLALGSDSRIATAGDDELLRLVRNGHRAATESIRTCSCRVAINYDPPPPGGNETAQYWRSGDDFRCLVRASTTTNDIQYRDGVVKRYSSDNQHSGDQGRNGRITTQDMAFNCSPWSYGQLTFLGREKYRVTLEQLLTEAHRLHSIKRETRDGRELIHLDLSHDRGRLDIWFDPAVNYLARITRVRTDRSFGDVDGETVVTSFIEPAPGIYFPDKVVSTSTVGKDHRRQTWTASFTDIKINEPLPTDALSVRFPPGLLVSDEIRKGMFRTDDRGEPVLPATNSQGKKITLIDKPLVPTAQPEHPSESVTQEELASPYRWILPASLSLLAVSAVLWAVKRWRAARVRDES
jgi:hypothetical protein